MPAPTPAASAPTSAPAWLKPGKRYRFENRSRSRWVLEVQPGGSDIIFGDKADRDVVGARDPIHRRSPIVELTAEQIIALPDHSALMLFKLIDRAEIDRQEISG